MFAAKISSDKLDRPRIDAEFYDPERLEALSWRYNWLDRLVSLESLSSKITDGTHVTPEYTTEGVYFLSSTNINCCSIDFQKTQFISSNAYQELEKSNCNPERGDILIAKNGKIGTAAQYLGLHPPCSLFVSVAIVRRPERIDRDYLAIFLNSKGGWSQFSRASKTGVITNLHLEEIREVEVVECNPSVQLYIGDKVRQAERLRSHGNQVMGNTRSVIEHLNHGDILAADVENERFSWQSSLDRKTFPHTRIELKHDRVKPTFLADRIDSWFYKPEFVRGDNQLQIIRESGIETHTLESFASVNYGFMPTEDYWDSTEGALFLRVTNIQDHLRLDYSKLEYVNPTLSRFPRYRLQEDDIVCVQCGNSTGRIALISSRCNNWVFPSFALRIRLKDSDWDSAYVAGYLSSWLGQSQIQRTISITSVRPNTTKPAIQAVTVPKFPLRTQQLIGKQLRKAIKCIEQSTPICDAAKLLVEALIERQVTEDELIHAQTRLEQGDESADRAILSRLFEGGWDADHTRPLFPDLDAYYETLRMVERESAEAPEK